MRNRQSSIVYGFTLVELQVALVLVALITVLLVGALRLGTQTWQKVTDNQDIAEHRFMLVQLLRRQLGNMQFVRVQGGNGEPVTGFFGDQKKIHFLAPFPTYKNDGQLYWWTLESPRDEVSGKHRLILNYRPYSASQIVEMQLDGTLSFWQGDEAGDGINEKIYANQPGSLLVADNIVIKETAFLTRDNQGVETWLREWQPDNRSPLVIKLSVADIDEKGGEFLLPEIAITPRFTSQQLFSGDR